MGERGGDASCVMLGGAIKVCGVKEGGCCLVIWRFRSGDIASATAPNGVLRHCTFHVVVVGLNIFSFHYFFFIGH